MDMAVRNNTICYRLPRWCLVCPEECYLERYQKCKMVRKIAVMLAVTYRH
jgi:hypothetical protein